MIHHVKRYIISKDLASPDNRILYTLFDLRVNLAFHHTKQLPLILQFQLCRLCLLRRFHLTDQAHKGQVQAGTRQNNEKIAANTVFVIPLVLAGRVVLNIPLNNLLPRAENVTDKNGCNTRFIKVCSPSCRSRLGSLGSVSKLKKRHKQKISQDAYDRPWCPYGQSFLHLQLPPNFECPSDCPWYVCSTQLINRLRNLQFSSKLENLLNLRR